MEKVLERFRHGNFSLKRIEEASKALKRYSHEDSRAAALRQFAQDFMRLRRDRRNYHQVAAWPEHINLVRSERRGSFRARTIACTNSLPEEGGRRRSGGFARDLKADVRGSTGITKDLLARG